MTHLLPQEVNLNYVQRLYAELVASRYTRIEKSLKIQKAQCIFTSLREMDSIYKPTGFSKFSCLRKCHPFFQCLI
jgi:hypothetical protein